MVNIKFRKFGRVYAPIYIKPMNKLLMKLVNFKVDTGADTSAISKLDLVKLGYNMDWIRNNVVIFADKDKPVVASGEKVSAGYIQLPLINIFGYEGKNWPFQVIVDEDKDFRNLLGRDLLTGFNYQFNNDDDIFSISMAKTFKPRYTLLPGQEIHELASGQ